MRSIDFTPTEAARWAQHEAATTIRQGPAEVQRRLAHEHAYLHRNGHPPRTDGRCVNPNLQQAHIYLVNLLLHHQETQNAQQLQNP